MANQSTAKNLPLFSSSHLEEMFALDPIVVASTCKQQLEELESANKCYVVAINPDSTLPQSAVMELKNAVKAAEVALNEAMKKRVFDILLSKENPILFAVKLAYLPAVKAAQKKDKETGRYTPTISFKSAGAVIDVFELDAHSKGDITLAHMKPQDEGKEQSLIASNAQGLLDNFMKDFFSSIDCDISFDKKQKSNTDLAKTLQALVDGIIYEERINAKGEIGNKVTCVAQDVRFVKAAITNIKKVGTLTAVKLDGVMMILMSVLRRSVLHVPYEVK